MFGTNPIRKQELGDGSDLAVQSIFSTIQGEGPFAGVPAVFVRLAGCNLRCHFCDTDFESGIDQRHKVGYIVRACLTGAREGSGPASRPPSPLVVLTGGEPLRQNILPLVQDLVREGRHVQIETAGTLWVPGLERHLHVFPDHRSPGASLVVSPKTGKVHHMIERWSFNWKYIVREGEVSDDDGLPIMSTQVPGMKQVLARPPQTQFPIHVFVQPCEEYQGHHVDFPKVMDVKKSPELWVDPQRSLANTKLAVQIAMKYGYRLSLQQHKIVGLE